MSNINIPIEETIKRAVQVKIEEEINILIETETKRFHDILVNHKDDYIGEIMKGIRIFHELEPETLGMNYKIVFENIVKVKVDD